MEGRDEEEAGTVPVRLGAEQLDGTSDTGGGAKLEAELDPDVAAAGDDAPVGPPDVGLGGVLDRLDSRLAESQRLLTRQTELTEKLHAENQALRAGELQCAQMPLVRGLIRLCDDLDRMRTVAEASAGDLSMVHESLLDVLARNGIESFAAERGEPFDSRLHSASGVEPTEDEQLHRTVAEVERAGFRWESGEVIRVVEVRAFRFAGSGEAPNT
jgi:molecular chaperone GrpE (heat shock protein)